MVDEVSDLVGSAPPGTFLDATLGAGGHAERILADHPQLSLLGVDQDPYAIDAARHRLARFGDRVRIEHGRFDRLDEILQRTGTQKLSGFLFDLGVSSPQLDKAERGFSYRRDGPLDMRMNPAAGLTAADLINGATEAELRQVISDNADERFAPRIAAAIVANRPFSRTRRLACVVRDAVPAAARRRGGHPAKRTFQALRIAVNDELDILAPTLEVAVDALETGGRGLVLTYHSGEDRIVKDVFRRRSASDLPGDLPISPEQLAAHEASHAALRPLARRPSAPERSRNRRASSARLRGIERCRPPSQDTKGET